MVQLQTKQNYRNLFLDVAFLFRCYAPPETADLFIIIFDDFHIKIW